MRRRERRTGFSVATAVAESGSDSGVALAPLLAGCDVERAGTELVAEPLAVLSFVNVAPDSFESDVGVVDSNLNLAVW